MTNPLPESVRYYQTTRWVAFGAAVLVGAVTCLLFSGSHDLLFREKAPFRTRAFRFAGFAVVLGLWNYFVIWKMDAVTERYSWLALWSLSLVFFVYTILECPCSKHPRPDVDEESPVDPETDPETNTETRNTETDRRKIANYRKMTVASGLTAMVLASSSLVYLCKRQASLAEVAHLDYVRSAIVVRLGTFQKTVGPATAKQAVTFGTLVLRLEDDWPDTNPGLRPCIGSDHTPELIVRDRGRAVTQVAQLYPECIDWMPIDDTESNSAALREKMKDQEETVQSCMDEHYSSRPGYRVYVLRVDKRRCLAFDYRDRRDLFDGTEVESLSPRECSINSSCFFPWPRRRFPFETIRAAFVAVGWFGFANKCWKKAHELEKESENPDDNVDNNVDDNVDDNDDAVPTTGRNPETVDPSEGHHETDSDALSV